MRLIALLADSHFGVLHVEASTSALLTFFLHVLNNVGELSFHSLTLIRFQERK